MCHKNQQRNNEVKIYIYILTGHGERFDGSIRVYASIRSNETKKNFRFSQFHAALKFVGGQKVEVNGFKKTQRWSVDVQ